MEEMRVSLCRVNRPDKNSDIWLKRLADIVDKQIVKVEFDESKEMIFDNRMFIFRKDGPKESDFVGLWRWNERQSESGRWLADATYIGNQAPIEIYVFNTFTDIEQLIQSLRVGAQIPVYLSNKVLFAVTEDNLIKGVLCDLSNCYTQKNDVDISIQLKNNVFSLPYFEININDTIKLSHRRLFYSRITLENPVKRLPTYSTNDFIKQMFIQRLNWPIFKAEGISKNDWRKVIHLLKDIPNESMVQRFSDEFCISYQEAQDCIDSFLQTVEQHIDVEDVDSGLIVKMLENHKGLKESCDKIAYQKWIKDHNAEIAIAQEEVDEIRKKGKAEFEESEQRLSAVKKAIVEAEKEHDNVSSQIEQANARLEELQVEIDRYKALGEDTVTAVRQRIAESQKDIAGFIADLSMFLPQTGNTISGNQSNNWQFICATNYTSSDDIEVAGNWNDEINLISQNLSYSFGIRTELCEMLSAFLYSSYINQLPLLVIGPGGQEVAECLSFSLFGKGSGKLIIGKGINYDIITALNDSDESVVSINNMFGEGWNDELPQMIGKSDKQILWIHPYAEDMLIEPKGLYNYMFPVFSEIFIETISDIEWFSGARADDFLAFTAKRKEPLSITSFKQLGISKLLLNRIETVLSDAKAIMDNANHNKDLEILFGLLPLTVLTEKTEVLKETIEIESGISEYVKEIASRYYTEE